MVFATLLSLCSHDTLRFVLLVVCIHNFMLIALILASPLVVAKVNQITASLDQVYWVEAARSVVDACSAPLRAAIASLNASITLLAAETATAREEQEELCNELRDELRNVHEYMARIKAVVHKLAKNHEDDLWTLYFCTGIYPVIETAPETAIGTRASPSASAMAVARAIDSACVLA